MNFYNFSVKMPMKLKRNGKVVDSATAVATAKRTIFMDLVEQQMSRTTYEREFIEGRKMS